MTPATPHCSKRARMVRCRVTEFPLPLSQDRRNRGSQVAIRSQAPRVPPLVIMIPATVPPRSYQHHQGTTAFRTSCCIRLFISRHAKFNRNMARYSASRKMFSQYPVRRDTTVKSHAREYDFLTTPKHDP